MDTGLALVQLQNHQRKDQRQKYPPRRRTPDRRVRCTDPNKLNFAPSSSSSRFLKREAQEEKKDQEAFLTVDIAGKLEGVQKARYLCLPLDSLLFDPQR